MSLISRVFGVNLIRNPLHKQIYKLRCISTSNKKNDTTSVIGPTTHTEETTTKPVKKKYFQDYGYNGATEKEETLSMHATFFFYVTLGLTLTTIYYAYRPDSNFKDWALREAYLELRRREELGLPLIDPNYVDPSNVYLPSDEELGDTEIII